MTPGYIEYANEKAVTTYEDMSKGDMISLLRKRDAERDELLLLLHKCQPIMLAHAGATHMLDGFRPKRNEWDELTERIDQIIDQNLQEAKNA